MKWNQKLGFAALFLTVSLLMAGCTQSDEQGQVKETIQKAVALQLNAPDDKSIFQNYLSDDQDDFEKDTEEYMSYLQETYGPYFTESTFEQYTKTSEFTVFHHTASDFKYQLKLTNVDVEQNKETPTNYYFTAQLEYTDKNGETMPIELNGLAIMRDDKIAKLSYLGDKKLLRSLVSGELEAK